MAEKKDDNCIAFEEKKKIKFLCHHVIQKCLIFKTFEGGPNYGKFNYF
jgi:hypothetical protein